MDSFENFKKLIELSMYLEKGKLLYVILVPFTNNQNYSLYNVSPQIVNLSLGYGYTKPFSKYYIIHNKYNIYVLFTDIQIHKYCKIIEEKYICSDTYIFNKLQYNSSCELKLIFNKEIKNIESCDIRITKNKKSHWTKSLDQYKLYSTGRKKNKNNMR